KKSAVGRIFSRNQKIRRGSGARLDLRGLRIIMAPVTFRSGVSLVGTLRLTALVFLFVQCASLGRAAVVLQIGNNFIAATYGIDSTAQPPDAALAVGTNHLVELINGRFSVFT